MPLPFFYLQFSNYYTHLLHLLPDSLRLFFLNYSASEIMEAADDYTILQTVEAQGHLLHQYHDQLGLLGTTMKEVLLVVNRLDNPSKVLHTFDRGPPTMGRHSELVPQSTQPSAQQFLTVSSREV